MTWTSDLWRTRAFADELRAFVTSAVGEPSEFRSRTIRPWSAVWEVEAGGARYFAKQNCPRQAHEARLVEQLGRIAPSYVVPVVAADAGRDLLLTPDLGRTLRETGPVDDVETWCRIVRDAALLQRAVLPHADRLGLTRLPVDGATTYVADAVGRLSRLESDDPRRMAADVAGRLQGLLPTVQRWADRVGDLGLPLTLNHNDLHDANVVAPDGAGSDGGPLRFFDFGDAVLTEPLAALLIPLSVCADHLDAGPDDPRLRRVAEEALEVWSDLTPLPALWAALPAALQLGRLARVESWRRCVATMTRAEQRDYGSAPVRWLGTLVADPPVGHLPPR